MQNHGPENRKYDCLIFDADHTLLDYVADELAAFSLLYAELGIPVTNELLSFSRHASETVWTESGMYDVHDKKVQAQYHRVYREHVGEIFRRVFETYGYPKTNVSPRAAGEIFLKNLENESHLFPKTRQTLAALSRRTGGNYAVCIATNGLSGIQRGRLKPLETYIEKAYISEEVGAIKPLPAFFERICKDMGADRSRCLMVGDSLYSDIAGANAAGIDSCWYNPHGVENETPFKPDCEVSDLDELLRLL